MKATTTMGRMSHQGQQRNVLDNFTANTSLMNNRSLGGTTYTYPSTHIQAQNAPYNCCPCIKPNNLVQTQNQPSLPEGLTYTFNPAAQQYALAGFM